MSKLTIKYRKVASSPYDKTREPRNCTVSNYTTAHVHVINQTIDLYGSSVRYSIYDQTIYVYSHIVTPRRDETAHVKPCVIKRAKDKKGSS